MKAKAKAKSKNKGTKENFFVYHGEKLAFVGVALVMLWLAYSGLTGYQPLTWQPDDLKQAASQADTNIKNSTVTPKDFDDKLFIVPYDEKATWIKKDISHVAYATEKKWEPTLFPDKIKRDVPTIFPVESLRAIFGNGPILSIDRDPVRRQTGNQMGMGGGMPGGGMPGGGMMGGMGGAGGGTKPVAKKWLVLTGLIPIKKQLAEYLNQFSNSMFTSPMIDTPQFITYEIERSEYDPTPGAVPSWIKIDATLQYQKELNEWASMGAEQVDRSYIAPPVLGLVPMAYPLPPMTSKLFGEEIAYPPYIPLLADSLVESMEKQEELLKKLQEFKPLSTEELLEEIQRGRGFTGAGTGGGMGMPGGGMGMPGGGMGMPGGGMGMPGGGMGMPGGGGMGMPGGGGMGMPGGGMAGRGMGTGGGRGVQTGISGRPEIQEYVPPALVDHYLFRFFDFEVEDEKSYEYRVRLIVRNPNFQLNPKFLEDENSNQVPVLYSEWSVSSQPRSSGREGRVIVTDVSAPATRRAWQEPTIKVKPIYFDMEDANEWVGDEKIISPGMVANFRSVSTFNPGSTRPTAGGRTPTTAGSTAQPRSGGSKTVDIVSDVSFVGSFGGVPVEGNSRSPARVLLMDANGTVVLRNLGTEQDESQKYSRTAAPQRGGMGGGMPGMGGPGMMGSPSGY